MLGAIRAVEQQLRDRDQGNGLFAEQQTPHVGTGRCSARLSRLDDVAPGRAQVGGEVTEVRRLPAALDAFEGDEQRQSAGLARAAIAAQANGDVYAGACWPRTSPIP
jgi:hypothetical protein